MPESGAWEHSFAGCRWSEETRSPSVRAAGGRDDIGSGVSMDDNLSLQLCDEPRPGAVFFFEGCLFSFFERRSVPPQQRRAAASSHGSKELMIIPSWDGILGNLMTAPSCACATSRLLHPPPPCDLSRRLAQKEWWRSPQRPRRHAHLPLPRSHPQHVWWELNTGRLGKSRPAQVAAQ